MSTINFYNEHAQHFQQTRQKIRPEFLLLYQALAEYNHQSGYNIHHILDIGCGAGRLGPLIDDRYKHHTSINISYQGIDNSEELIRLASHMYPTYQYHNADMTSYLATLQDNSQDIIISRASFQHLSTIAQRTQTLNNIHRVLKPGGIHISLNRSRSQRMYNKHQKPIIRSYIKHILTLGHHHINDLYIPWNGKHHTSYRYYHIFSLRELIKLHQKARFHIKEQGYTTKQGTISTDRKKSRNTRIVAQKIHIVNGFEIQSVPNHYYKYMEP